jgi:hypothetical protein
VCIVIVAGWYTMKNTKMISKFLQKPERSDLHNTWSMKEEFDKLKKTQDQIIMESKL